MMNSLVKLYLINILEKRKEILIDIKEKRRSDEIELDLLNNIIMWVDGIK